MATLSELRALEQEYIKAEKACLRNQSYTIKDRTFTKADLNAIRSGRRELQTQISSLSAGGAFRVRRIVPRDD